MVDGGGRCSCQDEFDPEAEDGDPHHACCSPQVFTSVLLGVLACVLMTGGVFLAFHRWDPLWLIVSGIGVLLILIGSILHCCSSSPDNSRTRHRGPAGKGGGCCGGRPPPDHMHHGHHLVTNNGSLTEQLLPLSNARSVSQLSLNMLPGYFPPVVTTTYGIEQHSAVVQNINRIVQQQQGPVPGSPGVQSSGGKSFILLSLPGNDPAQQANVQNLVGYTVYQLEESSAIENPAPEGTTITPPVPTTPSPPSAAPTTPSVQPPLFKSVEVQTCHVWPITSTGISPNDSQNASSSNSSTEITHSEIVQNSKPLQNASCSSSPTESAPSGIIQNNRPSSTLTTESAPSVIIQNNRMQKSSSSNSSTATPGISQNSFRELATPRISDSNNVQPNSTGNSSTESSSPEFSHPQKTCSNNSSIDSAAADHQQPSTSRTENVAEVNSYVNGIPLICDNSKCSGGATQSLQASRSLEDTHVSEASSSVLVGISESTVGESLLVVDIPEPSTGNVQLLEATSPITDILVEVDATTSVDVPPVSTTFVDIPTISTISSVSPSVAVTSADVPAMSTSSVDVPPMSVTSADVLPVLTSSTDIPPVSSDVLIDISHDTTSSSEIATSSGDTIAGIDSSENTTHQTLADVASDRLQVGVSHSDLSLSNLSDLDGEVDDSELLGRFSPPPSYDDAIHEGETAIGAFGLAYGTI